MARILVAGFCAVPGPHRAGVQISHVLRALSSRHRVEVLTVRKGEQAYVEQYRKTRMLRVPVPDGSAMDQIQAFRRALRRQLEGADYDIVHFRDGWSGLPVIEVAKRLNLRTVFDAARGPMAQGPLAHEALQRELSKDEELCAAKADLVLAPTESAARYLAAKGAGDRVHLAPPGVDIDRFDWENEPAVPTRIFYGGMVREDRGIRELLRAMVEIATRTDARLVLAGPVDRGFLDTLRADVLRYGLQERVDLLGPLDNEDMPRAISDATICVAPTALELSRRPTALYPTKLLEYMACRRVVVAPRRGTVTQLITEDEHGLLFKPGDATDLAAQILRLLADPDLRERLAQAGYEKVRTGHSASACRRRVLYAYDVVAGDLPEGDVSTREVSPAAAPVAVSDVDETGEVTDSQLQIAASSRAGLIPHDTDSAMVFSAPTMITPLPDDVTSVELDTGDVLASEEVSGPSTIPPDAWLVEQAPALPSDTDTASAPLAAVDASFAAGEVIVDTPPGGVSLTPHETAVFRAAGVLLGSSSDPEPETGESSPAPDSDSRGGP